MGVSRRFGSFGNGLQRLLLSDSRIIFIESVVIFLLFWQLATPALGGVEYFSTPILVAEGIYEILFVTGEAWPDVLATTRRIVLAFGFTMLLGTTLGVIMGITRFVKKLFTYYVTMMLSIPGLIAAVFSAMLLGTSDLTPMLATTLMTTPLISITVRDSVEDIDAELLEMSGAFNVPRHRTVWRVVIKAIAPALFGTSRYAFAVAWKITNLTEVIIADVGIGFRIRFFFNRLDTTGILKYVLLLSLLILIIEFAVIRQIEKHVFAHREQISVGFGGI